jgi:hypothetical protein
MPDAKTKPYAVLWPYVGRPMSLNLALTMISQDTKAICRRLAWDGSITHIFIECADNEADSLILMDNEGALYFYIPSLNDLFANDWVVNYI